MPQDSVATSDLRSRPQSLKWLARYAVWGMPLAYLMLVGLTAFGARLPTVVFKVFVGGGALYALQRLLKKEPHNEYALAARKTGRIQMAVMLLAELVTIPLLFVLPREHWWLAAAIVVIAAFGVHILVGILGSHRLQALAEHFA